MYAIFVTINVKEEHLEEFTQASFGDAEGACRDEPGCFRFDINQGRRRSHALLSIRGVP